MTRTTRAALALAAALAAWPASRAAAQSAQGPAPAASAKPAGASGLRGHLGPGMATRLLRSPDAGERLRGLERLAAMHTPEAVATLERAAGAVAAAGSEAHGPADGLARTDTRALLVTVRGLAASAGDEGAREALLGLVRASSQLVALRVSGSATQDPAADEAQALARLELAREEAAMALAATGDLRATSELVAIARSAGAGETAALVALAAFPPASPVLTGVALTTPATVELAAATGDLRAADAILGVLVVTDPALRAAALRAGGALGDLRVLEAARGSVADKDPRVRVAAAEALATLGDAKGPQAVEALVADPATTLAGLRLARGVEGEGIVRAAAAAGAAAGDVEVRRAALEALGRQRDPQAITALVALSVDAAVGGDAACALARSPSPAALGGIGSLAAGPTTRRLAARAYLVRRMTRGERDLRLDALLAALAGSADPVDRAVGVEALVALGDLPLDRALGDHDAGVRRAAAMGALSPGAHGGIPGPALDDPATRQVLSGARASIGARATTPELVALAGGSAADAPLAAEALAARGGDEVKAALEPLLGSRDPVMRAAVARGLATSAEADATGRLAEAYLFEGDAPVRRALVEALAARRADRDAPAWRDAVAIAASLDPDGIVRRLAARALAGEDAPAPATVSEVAWLQVVPAAGATLPAGLTGTVIASDGRPRPVAISVDGFAIVPGLPPGPARLRLAPKLPPDEAR